MKIRNAWRYDIILPLYSDLPLSPEKPVKKMPFSNLMIVPNGGSKSITHTITYH